MTKLYDFRGRTVVVTGASLGVGRRCKIVFTGLVEAAECDVSLNAKKSTTHL